jgi:hypothetical protein
MSESGTRYHPEQQGHAALIETVFEEAGPIRSGDVESSSGIIIEGNPTLSRQQREIAADQLRLYNSLCGGVVGQYWPQALLETGGSLNRPQFPRRHPAHSRSNSNQKH